MPLGHLMDLVMVWGKSCSHTATASASRTGMLEEKKRKKRKAGKARLRIHLRAWRLILEKGEGSRLWVSARRYGIHGAQAKGQDD